MAGSASFLVFVVLLGVLIGCLFFYIGARGYWSRMCVSAFECGFDVVSNSRVPFSLRFFLLTVVFLIFDVEIVLLLPVPFVVSDNMEGSIVAGIFFGVLVLGLVYEWCDGSLD